MKEGITMFAEYPDIVTVNDLVKMLHIGRNRAYKLVGDGSIRTIRFGTTHRIPKQCVIDYVMRVTAQHGEHSLRQRMGAERHPAVAGARGYRDNWEYLHPPHPAAEREHREGSGECVSEVGEKQSPARWRGEVLPLKDI